MNPMWLMRMARWARHPPSMRTVLLVGGLLAVCLAVWGAEQIWGWPDWLTVNGRVRRP